MIEGIPVRLVDTAGLREAGGAVEAEGIRRTEGMMRDADLIVYVLDGDEDDAAVPDGALIVRSKRDLTGIGEGLSFSSVTGEGLPEVVAAIAGRLRKDGGSSSDDIRIDSDAPVTFLIADNSYISDSS